MERVDITSECPADPAILSYVKNLESEFDDKFKRIVGYTEVEWDVRGDTVRTQVIHDIRE